MQWTDALRGLTEHLASTADFLEKGRKISEFSEFILDTRKRKGTLYLCAAGRSMAVLSLFGMRLAQDPINIDVMPLALSSKLQIKESDSLFICTGTGQTEIVCFLAKNWLALNHHVGLMTSTAARDGGADILGIFRTRKIKPAAIVFLPGMEPDDVKRRGDSPSEIYPSLLYYYRDGRVTASASKFELAVLLFSELIVGELVSKLEPRSGQARKS